jgi:glycosyltransferase involved in cell wall biosynthesis
MVSVIVPYNIDRGYLDVCLASIEAQTMPVELIESQSPETVGYNFNRGLEKAKGEFVKYVCEDDFLPPTAIEDLVNGIGDSTWICANAHMYGGQQLVDKSVVKPLEDLLINYTINGGTTLYRTDLLREIGGMDETLETGEEYDMHLKLISMGHIPAYIDKYVYYYRVWRYQKSRQARKERPEWRKEKLDLIKARYDKRNSAL